MLRGEERRGSMEGQSRRVLLSLTIILPQKMIQKPLKRPPISPGILAIKVR